MAAPADPPKTYLAKITHDDDVLAGNYSDMMAMFRTDGTAPFGDEDLAAHVLSASQEVPKVYLTLTTRGIDDYIVCAIHRPFAFLPKHAGKKEFSIRAAW